MNKVQHFEIPVENPDKAKKFYKTMFGWNINEVPGMNYWMIETVATDPKSRMPKEVAAINGGIYKRQSKAESPVVVVTVPSLDASLKKAQKEGAKVVMPVTKVGDMGLYARITDPDGNVIGIWQNLQRK